MKQIVCRSCGHTGCIKTFHPTLSAYNDIRCPGCGSTNNQHNTEYHKDMQAAFKKSSLDEDTVEEVLVNGFEDVSPVDKEGAQEIQAEPKYCECEILSEKPYRERYKAFYDLLRKEYVCAACRRKLNPVWTYDPTKGDTKPIVRPDGCECQSPEGAWLSSLEPLKYWVLDRKHRWDILKNPDVFKTAEAEKCPDCGGIIKDSRCTKCMWSQSWQKEQPAPAEVADKAEPKYCECLHGYKSKFALLDEDDYCPVCCKNINPMWTWSAGDPKPTTMPVELECYDYSSWCVSRALPGAWTNNDRYRWDILDNPTVFDPAPAEDTNNYAQVVTCPDCGAENICLCGRCKGCAKVRAKGDSANCDNCMHCDLDDLEVPCRSCERESHWEPAAVEENRYSEGICGDGAAILYDGVPVRISVVVEMLNENATLRARVEELEAVKEVKV